MRLVDRPCDGNALQDAFGVVLEHKNYNSFSVSECMPIFAQLRHKCGRDSRVNGGERARSFVVWVVAYGDSEFVDPAHQVTLEYHHDGCTEMHH